MKTRPCLPVLLALCALCACTDMGDPAVTPPADDGGNGHGAARRLVVSMRDAFFDPESLAISVGDTVIWRNQGTVSHTSTSGAVCGPSGDGHWDSGNLLPGETFTHVFPAAGEFPYYCIPHCDIGMTGHVSVSH
jgi:plastocyanin